MLSSLVYRTLTQINFSSENVMSDISYMEARFVDNNAGEKICESGKVSLIGGEANFDRRFTISCNMIFNPSTKIFKQKITKFSIILISQKGTKQAGEIQFDVAEYINEKQLNKKDYQKKLSGCPDKNAKLTFTLSGVLKEEVGMDARSLSSYANTQNSVLDQNNSNISSSSKNRGEAQSIPSQDKARAQPKSQNTKKLQQQNRKIKQQLKAAQRLKKENEDLRKKIKNQDYKKATDIKQNLEKYKKEIEKMKSQIRANKKIQDETTQLENDILHCKIKMMKAFNYAAEFGGSELVDKIQDYCGIMQK